MRPVRAILFDIGDTLVFDDPPLSARAWQASQAAGLPLSEDEWPTACRAAEAFALTAYADGMDWDEPRVLHPLLNCALRAAGHAPIADTAFERWAASLAATRFQRAAHPDAAQLLQELRRRGFRIGAVSDWEPTLPQVLADLGLLPHFHSVSASASVGARKPDPRLFEHALRELRVTPEEACHVGDWLPLDVRGAQAAGINAILYDHAGRAPDADGPRVETFQALAELLLTLPCPHP